MRRHDARVALRSLARTPRMFACAVVCLAGAIGAATAVFAIVNGVVLRPLSFQHADRLVAIWGVKPGPRHRQARVLVARHYRSVAHGAQPRWRRGHGERTCGHDAHRSRRTGADPDVDRLREFLRCAWRARQRLAGHSRSGKTSLIHSRRSRSAMRCGSERFGVDPSIVGQTLTLDGRSFVVSGVAPRGFAYPPRRRCGSRSRTVFPNTSKIVGVGWLEIIGRMKEGITPDGCACRSRHPARRADEALSRQRGREDVSVVPLQRELLGDTRPALWALLAAVLVLLAVACANVGGLLPRPGCGARPRPRCSSCARREPPSCDRRGAGRVVTVLMAVSRVVGDRPRDGAHPCRPRRRAWKHPWHR